MTDEEKKVDETTTEGKDSKEEAVVSEDALEGLSPESKKLIETVEKMTVLELNKLVKAIEKRFGVSAQAVQVAAQGAGADSGEEEKDIFTVELKDIGEQKIAIIKAVKALLGLGLKDAKDLVDAAPSVLKEGVKKEEAEEIKKLIEGAGGTVELK